MPLRDNELAHRYPAGLELRAGPVRVSWEFPDLITSDGHELRCNFRASVRALPDRTEKQALDEVLMQGRTALFAEDVSRHFYPALRSAAAKLGQSRDAQTWIESDASRQTMAEGLKATAAAVAFSCGLEILPPLQVDLNSPSYDRVCAAALQQQLLEKEAVSQAQRLAHTAELIKQFQSLRASAPELTVGQVLERVADADRGSVMQALLLAGARESASRMLWAVAGPYLVRIETAQGIDPGTPPAMQLIPLPPTLGPLRSVQCAEVDGERKLLVGAQRGFFLANVDDPTIAKAYVDGGVESALGFNRVIYWPQERQFCATHSEAGLVCWQVDAPDAPAVVKRPPALGIFPSITPEPSPVMSMSLSLRSGSGSAGPRNLARLESGTLVFSAGSKIFVWNGQAARAIYEGSRSEIIALQVDRRIIQVIHEEGTIETVDAGGKSIGSPRRYNRLRAVGVLPWMGGNRLLLGADDGPMQCIGLDDPVVTQYFSPYRGLRAIAASASVIATVSPDRQRLVLWNSWEGRQPALELFIGAQARHRVADVVFA